MARQKEDKYYGSDYLTGAQQIEEDFRLAPGGAADVGRRLGEDVASLAAANRAANPLLAPRDTGLVPTTTEVTPVSAAPNPFTRPQTIQPPVPLSAMGVEQQMAWQEYADVQRAKQTDEEAKHLNAAINRQNLELRTEQIRQNRELTSEIPKLREALNKDPNAYLDLKADLARRFPIGMGSPESDKILGEYEKIYAKKEGVEADLNKAKIARVAAAQQKRLDALYAQAEKLGPDVARGVAARAETNPEDASRFLAEEQRKDIKQQLINTGMTEQEVAARFPGEFPIRAAEAEIKRQMTPVQQATQLRNQVSDLAKLRSDPVYYSTLSEPDKAALDANLKSAQAEYNAIQSRGLGDRGVQGMRALQVAREQAMGYNTGPAQQQPVTSQTTAVAAPSAPARSWLPSVGQVARVVAPVATPLLATGQALQQLRGNVAGQFVGGARESAVGQPAAGQPAQQPVVKERRKVNPQTGEVIVLRNGKWVPI